MGRHLLAVMLVSLVCGSVAVAPQSVHAAEEAEHHAAEGDHGSAPSLPLEWKGDLALWSFVTFLAFFLVLQKLAWKPLSTELTNRENKIAGDIAAAESHRFKAEAMLKDYETKLGKVQEEVAAILAEARRDAEHTKQEIVATAQREADANRQRAVADIERAKDGALSELFDFVSNNVVQATERMLQRSVSPEDQERLVREALADLNIRRN
ncbi:MAG TPA: F0F1 ATP synthase subunit B [Planctomycetaceae bacterium]|jgi:F-type H+-transporting ATPase subunit b|nr:F0F1 ATP synthase subunit B [Planctomycetaceae bacterium]